MSDAIVDAIINLAENIQLDVTTGQENQPTNPYGVDATRFIKAVTPFAAVPVDSYDSMDETTFYSVNPGTTVEFNVDFRNDFFEPQTLEVDPVRGDDSRYR